MAFMSVEESAAFAKNLAGLGLKFLWEGHAIDIAIADQVVGLRTPCDWIDCEAGATDTDRDHASWSPA